MDRKTRNLAVIASIMLASILVIGWGFVKNATAPVPDNQQEQVVRSCMMEAKTCPDGSPQGVISETCEYAECPAASGVEGWQIYRNEEYGFEIKMTEAWKGFRTKITTPYEIWQSIRSYPERIEENSYDVIFFEVPTNDEYWKNENDGFYDAFSLNIIPIDVWSRLEEDDKIFKKKGFITKNNKYVFTYSISQDLPNDIGSADLEVNRIISTFKFIEPAEDGTADLVLSDVEGWQTYRNEAYGFKFDYPAKLKLYENNVGTNLVELKHSVRYENSGSCDMVAETTQSKTLDDLTITFEVRDEIVKLEFDDGDYSAGTLKGKYVYEGVEGCPPSAYYFPFKENKTLVVKLWIPQQLSGNVNLAFFEGLMEVPGLIKSDESMRIFDQILSTFKFTK